MTFFNRKEEVLEVRLTPYGRRLLSLGKMEPVYYSFFDDDILYDSDYVSSPEEQSATESRIKETPRSHSQVNFVGAGAYGPIQNHFVREHALNSELGITDYYSENAPAWDVSALKGEITSSVMVLTSSAPHGRGLGPVYKIPQINMSDPTYEKIIGHLDPGPQPLIDADLERTVTSYNTTYLEVREDFILLEINEENVSFQKENFEIELFEVANLLEGKQGTLHFSEAETLIPLRFDGPGPVMGTLHHVDYAFDLDVDLEIDTDVLCRYKGVDTAKGLFLQRTFALEDCEGPPDRPPTSQYRTAVEDIGEVCD